MMELKVICNIKNFYEKGETEKEEKVILTRLVSIGSKSGEYFCSLCQGLRLFLCSWSQGWTTTA